MEEVLDFIIRYKYLVLFGFVFAEQVGLPLPALPVLLAGGALARTGQLHLGLALLVATAASVLSDLLWYEIGRRRGIKVLNLLCRISLEPDSCVRRTEDLFARHGARSLLIAKFLPGFNTVAPPLAGIFGMRLSRFVVFDALGALLWIVTFGSLGYAFGQQLEELAEQLAAWGTGFGLLLVGALAAYILIKYVQRQRFLRQLRIARITPAELAQKLDAGEDIVVVDLRHSVEFEAEPVSIPGALHVPVEQAEQRTAEIPQGPEVVLFCT
ncbi:MAG: VTT domain-containing protein [Acidobacteriota bacterium]